MASAAPDPRDLAAAAELEAKLVEATRKLRAAEAAAASAASSGRRAALTKAQLEGVPAEAPLHVAAGRAFLAADRAAVLSDLDAAVAAAAADAEAATAAAKGLRAKVADVEGELRELLESSPALAATKARG